MQDKLELELENKRGLKLCIHERDLEAGNCLLNQIDEHIVKCRKTILVLSPEYLKSFECRYVAWSAHAFMVSEDRDAVVLVKFQPLPLGIPGSLASMMAMRECLIWTENPVGQELFWKRLAHALLYTSGNPINA